MEEIEIFPLDVVQKLEEGKSILYIYGVSGNERLCLKFEGFSPYFLVVPEAGQEELLIPRLTTLRINVDGRVVSINRVEKVEKRAGLKPIHALRCYTSLPMDIPPLTSEVAKLSGVASVEERDIKFINRFLIDTKITPFQKLAAIGEFEPGKGRVRVFRAEQLLPRPEESYADIRVMGLDIEIPAKEIDASKHPIIMLAVYSPKFKRVLTWKRFTPCPDYVEFVEDERALIERFDAILAEQSPDMLCGYFSDGFDLPYIKERAERLGVDFKPGLNLSGISISKGINPSAYIEGIPHIDVFKFIKYLWGQGLDTNLFDLDSVAKEILGEGKEGVDIDGLGRAWEKGGKQLGDYCRYNLKDAELCFRLCEKILPSLTEFVKLTRMTPFQLSRSRFSKLVEGYLIAQAYEQGVLVPPLPSHKELKQRRTASYPGAFVYEPKPGLHSQIVVFDFMSLYPTIISAHNISPETLNCDCCASASVPGHPELRFCTRQRGFIPEVIRELITRRMRLKQLIKKGEKSRALEARSHALKTLANAMYGYLGFFGSRWYSFEAALSITAYGRFYLNKVVESARAHGFEVIYGDTDSIFLLLKEKSLEEALEFAERLNQQLPDLMELQFEGLYPRGLFVGVKHAQAGAKKKYALLDREGHIKITGFETVRRNWSLLARNAQKRVLEIILKHNDVAQAKRYISELAAKVKANEVPKQEMIIRTQLQKPVEEYESVAPHVAVAKKLRASGVKVTVGQMIEYIVLTGKGGVGERAVPADSVENPDYDTDYYVKNQIIPAVESIFKELGVDPGDIISTKDQSSLSSFMK